MRGNPAPADVGRDFDGSIPACAGEPEVNPRSRFVAEVYPRVCGGTQHRSARRTRNRGLSPRVRGNHRGRGVVREWHGSIPACAGEPNPEMYYQYHRQVYPRVCGGTALWPLSLRRPRGLSPRVRGNPSRSALRAHTSRSIPACAGEPYSLPAHLTADMVYPRVCGGTLLGERRVVHPKGLSPRVRGNLESVAAARRRWRSIPACAGEPNPAAPELTRELVYPRVCGGTSRAIQATPACGGLSPRVRGEPCDSNRRMYSIAVYPRVCGGTLR